MVSFEQLSITAMEHGMGGMLPEEILPEAKRQGLILAEKEGKLVGTTKEVLAEERRMLALRALGPGHLPAARRPGPFRSPATG